MVAPSVPWNLPPRGPQVGDENLQQAMKWLKKCHPELANCNPNPSPSELPGWLGDYGLWLFGPIFIDRHSDVETMVATLAHEEMHCLEGLALGAFHDQMLTDAELIKLEYRADPSGDKCKCNGYHIGGARQNISPPPQRVYRRHRGPGLPGVPDPPKA